jgi:hypothetical protein
MKSLARKRATYNPEIEASELISILQSTMPSWNWNIKTNSGERFSITGTNRWHELSLFRDKDGYIYHSRDVRLRYVLFTFGLAYIFGEITGDRHRVKVEKILRSRVEVAK